MQQNPPIRLLVRNIPAVCDKTKLKMVFENVKGCGRRSVKQVKLNYHDQTAVLEFENAFSVDIVLKKRPIMVDGKHVQVEMFSGYLEPDENLVSANLIGLGKDLGKKLKILQHDTEVNAFDQIPIADSTVNQQVQLTYKLNAFCEELRHKLNETVIENQQQQNLITEINDHLAVARNILRQKEEVISEINADLRVARSVIQQQKEVISEMNQSFAEFQALEIQLSDTIKDLRQSLQASSNKQFQQEEQIKSLQDKLNHTRDESNQISELLRDCENNRRELIEIAHGLMEAHRKFAEFQFSRNKALASLALLVMTVAAVTIFSLDYPLIPLLLFMRICIFLYVDLDWLHSLKRDNNDERFKIT